MGECFPTHEREPGFRCVMVWCYYSTWDLCSHIRHGWVTSTGEYDCSSFREVTLKDRLKNNLHQIIKKCTKARNMYIIVGYTVVNPASLLWDAISYPSHSHLVCISISYGLKNQSHGSDIFVAQNLVVTWQHGCHSGKTLSYKKLTVYGLSVGFIFMNFPRSRFAVSNIFVSDIPETLDGDVVFNNGTN